MDDIIAGNQVLIAKYSELLSPSLSSNGGIFTKIARKRLLGISGKAGRDRSKSDFWYDRRENIKNALIDLQLFIEVAGDDNIYQVISRNSLESVFRALLRHPILDKAEPDLNRAQIAQYIIEAGFDYLRRMKESHVTASHDRTINDAIDLSRYLVESFKPESDRRYRRDFTPPWDLRDVQRERERMEQDKEDEQ